MIPSPSRSALTRFLPSFGEFILAFPAIAIALHPSGLGVLLNDGDTGWHIRTGEWILQNRSIPRVDLFSFTKAGHPWFAWEWLWDLWAASIHSLFGLSGVALCTLFLLCLTYYFIYRQALALSANPPIACGVTFLAILASWGHWLARPHVFSLFFLVCAVWFIRGPAASRKLRLLWLVPLTVLWVNTHGAFVMLILVLGANAAGEFLNGLSSQPGPQRGRAFASAAAFCGAAALCAAASVANPFGLDLHRHIAAYLQDPILRERTVEFRPPNLASPPLFLFLLLDLGTLAWCIARKRFTDALLIAGTAFMALSSSRHVSVHAAVAAPLLCQACTAFAGWAAVHSRFPLLRDSMQDLLDTASASSAKRWSPAALAIPFLVAILWILAAAVPFSPRFRGRFPEDIFPIQALQSLPPSESGLRLFADDRPGYAVYVLWPRAHVFWDGRLDFYGSSMLEIYDQIRDARPGWQSVLSRHRVNAMLLHKDTAIAGALLQSTEWVRTFDDGRFVLFRLKP